jgi:hypothetical protein
MILKREKEGSSIKMDTIIRECGRKISLMEKEFMSLLSLIGGMREIGWMVSNMEKARKFLMMGLIMRGNGEMG